MTAMNREAYISHLRALYLAANSSDSDPDHDGTPLKSDWMRGDECSLHCCALDQIARDMGLGEDWLEEPMMEVRDRISQAHEDSIHPEEQWKVTLVKAPGSEKTWYHDDYQSARLRAHALQVLHSCGTTHYPHGREIVLNATSYYSKKKD